MPEPDVLSIHEPAAFLLVGPKTGRTLAQSGEVPGLKVGGRWRFRRRDIEAWIDERTRLAPKGGKR